MTPVIDKSPPSSAIPTQTQLTTHGMLQTISLRYRKHRQDDDDTTTTTTTTTNTASSPLTTALKSTKA